MRVAYKVWLDNNGKAFGEGPYELLKRIEATGSLHQAAMDMKMSYRKAWMTLKAIESKLGFPLLERRIGGISGGGSRITDQARLLMHNYDEFRKEVEAALEEIYQRHFNDFGNQQKTADIRDPRP